MITAPCTALATSGGHTGWEIWKLVWNMAPGCDKHLYRSPSQPMLMMTDGFIVILQFLSNIHINIETRHCKATPSATQFRHTHINKQIHTCTKLWTLEHSLSLNKGQLREAGMGVKCVFSLLWGQRSIVVLFPGGTSTPSHTAPTYSVYKSTTVNTTACIHP
jgi:hypothetical protein